MGTARKLKELDTFDEVSEHLQPGKTLLQGQYTIESYLNSGGFGITYTARDSLDRKIVIKECFPNAFCQRSQSSVRVRLRENQADFQSVVKLFVQEAKSLSKLKHPNIVGVHQVFEDNNTAYMALDFIDGRDLHDTLSDKNHGLSPTDIESILVQLLKAVSFMHKENILHRDISPDNILLSSQNKPVLIDFGAARQQIPQSDRVKTAFRVVKDGYSPQEFYLAGSQQSPSSDLYALAATFYHLIAGEAPPNSQSRLAAIAGNDADPCVPLAQKASGYEPAFLDAIDKALRVLPKDRIQQASEWLALIGHGPLGVITSDNNVVKLPQSTDTKDRSESRSATAKPAAHTAQASICSPAAANSPAGGSRLAILLASAAVVALAGGVALYKLSGTTAQEVAISQPVNAPTKAVAVAKPSAAVQAPGDTNETAADLVEPVFTPGLGDIAPEIAVVAKADNIAQNPPVIEPGQQIASDWKLPAGSFDGPSGHVQPAPETGNSGAATQSDTNVSLAQLYVSVATPDVSQLSNHDSTPMVGLPQSMVNQVSDDSVSLAWVDGNDDTGINLTFPVVSGEVPSLSLMRLMANLSGPDMVSDASFSGDLPADPPVRNIVPPKPAALASSPDTRTDAIVLDAASVISGWSVDLPFSKSAASANTIGSVAAGAPAWMQVGVQIVSVNGQPIAAFDEISPILRNSVEPGDANEIFVTFGTQQGADKTPTDIAASLPIVQEVVFLNGTKFDARFVDGKWQTQVVRIPDQVQSDLMAGDILQAYVPMGIDISGPDTLARIVAQNASFKDVILNFTVLRDGGVWLASYAYKNAAVF